LIPIFVPKKSKSSVFFWVTKKMELFGEKSSKSSASFFEKIKNGTFGTF
jgi:hypothetical protein